MDNFLINDREMKSTDWLFDAAVALGVGVFCCVQVLISSSFFMTPDDAFMQLLGVTSSSPKASVYFSLVLIALPLVARRKFSWPVFLFVTIVFLGTQGVLRGNTVAIIGPMVAIYTLAHERDRNEAVLACMLAVLAFLFFSPPVHNSGLAWFMQLQNISCILAAAFGGFAIRARQENIAATEQRAIAAEKSREEEAARRVEAERVRIAREVHDITAHSLSAVSIQSAAAERLIDTDTAAAKEAVRAVRVVAREALEEIRGMIGVLRSGDTPVETAPTTGTDRISDLVEYLENAGLAVFLEQGAYDRGQVPAYIDVALFGIAREAATNIVRHAQATQVTVRLATDSAGARLTIEDDGVGSGDAGAGEGEGGTPDGHGLAGMAERVGLLGGTFAAHNRLGRGFAVSVVVPLAPPPIPAASPSLAQSPAGKGGVGHG